MDVELIGIRKTFGPVVANDDITLCIPSGTIQGILGENGAGKSTLMKVLSGFIQADSGKIVMDGREIKITSPADAILQGVGMLHQDPLDFPPMKVIENFLTGSAGKLVPNLRETTTAFLDLQRQFDFTLDPQQHVDSLTVGERQQLEILRLLWLGAKVLILDEPTTGISAPQKVKLFETLKLLASQGKTIIFVSHKLEDVEQLCGRVAVLRRGKLVGEAVPPYHIDDLVTLMFGKIVSFGGRSSFDPEQPIMQLKGVSVEDYRTHIPPVNLDICSREVIGLAGMEGSGQLLFLRACAGLVRPTGGHVLVNGQDLTGHGYHSYMREGVAYMPASRMEEGLVPGLNLTEHVALTRKQKGFFIDWDDCRSITTEQISHFNIRGRPESTVESLSGGNQQRALLSLMRRPAPLILMEHPTRGLDVESSLYIWSLLKERCGQGSAILFISADLDEILQYSDRILVFFAGRVSAPLDAAETSVDKLGQLIGGKGF
jgi:simple sugar transport system ATP-binding protein